jgi:RNA polymerase sigma factor (sigma-70 family)
MIFKCEACEDWNGGEGTDKCLNCAEYKYVGREKSRIVVEYYANPFEEIATPESWESLYHTSRSNTVWDDINRLDWREATMLTQYYFLEMTQADIAEYHGIKQYQVHRIITKSLEKIKKF